MKCDTLRMKYRISEKEAETHDNSIDYTRELLEPTINDFIARLYENHVIIGLSSCNVNDSDKKYLHNFLNWEDEVLVSSEQGFAKYTYIRDKASLALNIQYNLMYLTTNDIKYIKKKTHIDDETNLIITCLIVNMLIANTIFEPNYTCNILLLATDLALHIDDILMAIDTLNTSGIIKFSKCGGNWKIIFDQKLQDSIELIPESLKTKEQFDDNIEPPVYTPSMSELSIEKTTDNSNNIKAKVLEVNTPLVENVSTNIPKDVLKASKNVLTNVKNIPTNGSNNVSKDVPEDSFINISKDIVLKTTYDGIDEFRDEVVELVITPTLSNQQMLREINNNIHTLEEVVNNSFNTFTLGQITVNDIKQNIFSAINQLKTTCQRLENAND